MKIEQLKTETLIPYARNAKMHSDSQVAAIAGSIKEFGFCNPVLIDKDGGIIAGHGRVLAARKLKLEKVPCIRLGHLDDNQRRAYILADNRLAETGGGWDMEMLQAEIAAIEWPALADVSIDDFCWGALDIETAEDPGTDRESSAVEIDTESFEMECRCPKCGFEFDPKDNK
jgi:hypothetical protein